MTTRYVFWGILALPAIVIMQRYAVDVVAWDVKRQDLPFAIGKHAVPKRPSGMERARLARHLALAKQDLTRRNRFDLASKRRYFGRD